MCGLVPKLIYRGTTQARTALAAAMWLSRSRVRRNVTVQERAGAASKDCSLRLTLCLDLCRFGRQDSALYYSRSVSNRDRADV